MNKELAKKLAKVFMNKLSKDRVLLVQGSNFLGFVYDLYKKEKLFRDFVLNPKVPNEKKIVYLTELSKKFSMPSEVGEFINHLVELNAIPMLGEIKRVYDYEMEKFLKLSKAFLIVAKRVDDDTLQSVMAKIKQSLNRELEFEVLEDPSLIGGFVVKTSGMVIDASVKRVLERFV
ncbi:ATP synthase F1 subunit delta [Thermocrinis sp.]|uniref:ATP synthase F1 subunit delta n=1 Tax=Thermocrinis sp. TaxID=2024383 RepID=UPI002FDE9663